MKASKRYIPILITLALLALIGLQIIWLIFVYKYKAQELKDKTREAALETTKRLQKEEDSKLILNNIDSLLVTDNIIGSDSKEDIRVMVSNIKSKFKIDTIKDSTDVEKKTLITNDSTTSTTVVKVRDHKNHKVIIKSESFSTGNIKKKATELGSVFLKMAVLSNSNGSKLYEKFNSHDLKKILVEELTKVGVNIEPEVTVISKSANGDTINLLAPNHSTISKGKKNNSYVSLPLFQESFVNNSMLLEVGFISPTNFIIKRMAGLVVLSIIITILIGFVMIYIFRKMLSQEKLHKMKNDFINNMTHELKTPIATISLAVDGINNPAVKNDTEKFSNYTAILKEENKKLNNHVERVLQMALLEKGELVLNKKSLNIKLLLENCIHSQQLQIQNKKAKVTLNSVESVPIIGDEFHLTNAFTNLLDNALKYSGENCEITITLNKNGEIRFKDNGIGIDKTLQEKVFEKFYRAQGGNLHDVKGFGLGLSYVKSIIEAHNGTIELKSEKNKGSEFIIKFKNNVG